MTKRSAVLGFVTLAICCTAVTNAKAQNPDDEVEMVVYTNGITLSNKSSVFYAPHTVASGESFRSISTKYYGSEEWSVYLSEVNKKSPLAQLEPGSTVYIVSDQTKLYFSDENSEEAVQTIEQFLDRVGPDTPLTHVWDEADIATELSTDGEWIINRYNTSKLRLIPSGQEGTELQFAFAQRSLLNIIILDDTLVDSVWIEVE